MKIPTIRQLPSGNYFCQLRINGQSISITEPTYDQAYAKAVAYKSGLVKAKKEPKALTLRAAIDQYIDARSNALSPSTVRGYRIIQRNRFQSVMDKPISSAINWQRVCNAEARVYSGKTMKNTWGFISSVLADNNVEIPSVTLPQVIRNERTWLTADEIPVFVKAMEGHPCEIAALLALHSLRRSELYALTWDKIDLNKKTLRISGSTVYDEANKLVDKKTNKNQSSNRIVPILIPALETALSAVDFKEGRVVTCGINAVTRRIRVVCLENGLPEVGLHGLRHSFASLAHHLGMPELECMKLGGWSDASTMRSIYTHIADKDLDSYAQKMRQFYAENTASEN